VSGGELWRVGHRGDPLAFTPVELCAWNHRFDDVHRRFRTVYCAERPETSLREVLADLRPNLEARLTFAEAFGAAMLDDLPTELVTARWREEHMLAPAKLVRSGELIDLTEPAVRTELEQRHAELLIEHGLQHLDLHEITARRRALTQTIASDLFDNYGAAALRFPSRLDGRPALVAFEGRAQLVEAGDPIALTDPAPPLLNQVCEEWSLQLERVDPL
ncbi:MAG TPA: RES domain-containing protein, partial [Solirubrobacterales bacterium]|nr:RES domain-containing protein [Solirubrobacterales bacterium]